MPHLIHLKSTDSREATDDELQAADITPEQIPTGFKLMAHQVKTIRALRKGDAPIIVNQAMTGDGKSLAGQFQLFNDRSWRTFAMYPTNELANDQKRGLEARLETWIPPVWRSRGQAYAVINSSMIDDYLNQFEVKLSRAESLRELIHNDYVMTNPDIFHLILSFAYTNYTEARDTTLGELAKRYRLFVFDEFHLFGVAQVSSVMMALLLLRHVQNQAKPPRFLFLSATPQKLLESMAAQVNIKVENVEGYYLHGLPDSPAGYRRILQPVTLYLHTGSLEDWVEAHLEDVILSFFKQHQPGAKGVIIANSIATAHRVRDFLDAPCRAAGIGEVGINTGITPLNERDYNVNLLVATSTIDVGVDFRINLLIFESLDAASHTQRLGRLGRHIKSVDGYDFRHFESHALLPPWVVEGMASEYPEGSIICRDDYKNSVTKFFQPLQTFEHYVHKWAGLQAAQVLQQLGKFNIKKQYEHVTKPLKEEYITLFGSSIRKYIALSKENQLATLDAATSFRGSSPFTAIQVDAQKPNSDVTAYNLITLLRSAELESIDLETLYSEAEHKGQKRKTLERAKPLAAYRRHGWLAKPRTITIRLHSELGEEQYGRVIEQTGFQFDVVGIPELMRLNDTLEIRPLVTLLIPYQKPETLRRILKLGTQLQLLDFKNGSITGTAVFGRDALLMDVVLYRYRNQSNQPIIL